MRRSLGCLFRMAIFLVLAFVSIVIYRLWDKGEFKDGFSIDIEKLKHVFVDETAQLTEEISQGSQSIGDKIGEHWKEIDWADLKKQWALTEKELDEYRKSLNFLSQDEPSKIVNDETQQKVTSPIEKSTNQIKSESKAKETYAPPIEVKIDQSLNKSTSAVQSTKTQPPSTDHQYPNLSNNKDYISAIEILEKAKAENRLGMPQLPNSKKHLKIAVGLYKKCQISLIKVAKLKKLAPNEEQHCEALLQEIGKQIYWGTKLGGM